MADIIESIAELTKLRDPDALEMALCNLLFEQVAAAGLRLWQATRRDGEIWLRECIHLPLPENPGATCAPAEKTTFPLEMADANLRRCCEGKRHLRLPSAPGKTQDLFPLVDGREVVGVMEIICMPELTGAQERLVLGLLQIYRNYRAVLNDGDHDELTGLWNRRSFGESFKRMSSATDRWRRKSVPARVHLAVVDIDFFKRINDTFGHPYGDEVLVLLARLMKTTFRDTDPVFRFGGEEFVVMLLNTDLAETEQALERFRSEVENFNFSQVGRVTVSIGFTSLSASDTGPNAFGRADQALYVAKHGGRNQVQCYELLVANGSLVSAAAKEQEVELF